MLTPIERCGELSLPAAGRLRHRPLPAIGPVLVVGGGRVRSLDDESHDQDPARTADARDDDRRSLGATADVLTPPPSTSRGADVVGAVEPTDDGGADGPHAEVDFLGDSQSLRRRSHAGTRSPARHPRAQAISREAQALGL
jgi:hypothetical protein